jgi:hypothetical protein
MNRFIVAAVVAASAFATAIATHAECVESASGVRSSADPLLTPAPHRVPLVIRVTEARRVFVRDANAPSGRRYVCTTPCRLFVEPGPVDVTLVGWGSHEYHWDVPARGGSVSLLARPAPGSILAARRELLAPPRGGGPVPAAALASGSTRAAAE